MHTKFLKNSFVIIVFALTFTCASRVTFAEEMTMDAFHAEFQQATGKTWESATSGEKRDFVNARQKTAAQTLQKKKEKSAASNKNWPNLQRSVSIAVRKQFLQKNGKNWDEAGTEEQEIFLKQYKVQKNKEARQEEKKIAQKEAIEKAKMKQKQMKIKIMERKKRDEESKKRAEKQVLNKKKAAERKKMEKSMQKLKKMRDRLRRN